MVHYAECAGCRRAQLLRYFGEEFWPGGPSPRRAHDCGGACDNCLSPRATFDGTLAAQKFLSCVYRIREKNGFGVGLNHVVEVLTGADTEKIRKWDHTTQLSTYGIGKEHSRPNGPAIGRELVRLGLSAADGGKIQRAGTDRRGRAALKRTPKKITLTKPATAPETKSRPRRRNRLRRGPVRAPARAAQALADERDVPAYIVFSDVALRQMARNYPASESEFARISGVGEKKLREFGEVFSRRNRRAFADQRPPDFCRRFLHRARRAAAARSSLGDSARETLRRFRSGQSRRANRPRTRRDHRHHLRPHCRRHRARRAGGFG
jgi:ATP-dependent DNA helicase RecQ